jgi:hypothetical protein
MKKKKRKRSRNPQTRAAPSFQQPADARSSSLREDLRRDLRNSKLFGPKEPILLESPGKEKMSEVLMEFARPYLDKYGNDPAANKKIVALAVVAWNMAIIPLSEKPAMIEKLMRVFPASQRSTAGRLLRDMEDRKRKLFNGIKRYIVHYKVKESADSINIYVASTPTQDQMAEIRKNYGKPVTAASEFMDSALTGTGINGACSADAPSECKPGDPQRLVPKTQGFGAFRSMFSKMRTYCLGRWISGRRG